METYIIDEKILEKLQHLIEEIMNVAVSRVDDVSPKIKNTVELAKELRHMCLSSAYIKKNEEAKSGW